MTVPGTTPTVDPVLSLRGLEVGYRTRQGVVPAVRGVDLDVAAGEIVAVVGESGSGKSTTALAAIGLLPGNGAVTAGRILFEGQDLAGWTDRRLQTVRGSRIGYVPQDPAVSLNPVKRIGEQIAEVLRVHGGLGRAPAAARAVEILDRAGIPEPNRRSRQYPHEFSGGMRQRVLIGIALACDPSLVIADEPTSALDVTVQRRILDHLEDLARSTGVGVLLITHDLGVAGDRSDRVVVMQHGRIVESGATKRVLGDPEHPYTRRLLAAAPSLNNVRLRPAVAVGSGPTSPGEPAGSDVVLRTHQLSKRFTLAGADGSHGDLLAVDRVGIALRRGRTLGVIGESGSGKSTLARLALRLERPSSGQVELAGRPLVDVPERELRRRAQLVYQNPYSSVDPRWRIEDVVAEPARAFRQGNRAERRKRVLELLDQVRLPEPVIDRRAAELSGGQRQRVAIARALILRPEIVVLDEPVSALDVSVQEEILRLLVDLQAQHHLSYLFISHDFAVVRQISDDVVVMRGGRVVESGPAETLLTDPAHDYTRALLDAVPGRRKRLRTGLSAG